MADFHTIAAVMVRLNTYYGGLKIEPYDIVDRESNYILLIRVSEGIFKSIGDTCNNNGEMV